MLRAGTRGGRLPADAEAEESRRRRV